MRKQAEIGLDIVDDGEFGKPSFVTYVRERLGGLSEVGGERTNPWGGSRDARAFPDFYRKQGSSMGRRRCSGRRRPITYAGAAALASDLDNLKAALAKVIAAGAFVPSISPANIENWHENQLQDRRGISHAIAMRCTMEYRAIVDAGFLSRSTIRGL